MRALLAVLAILCSQASDGLLWLAERLTRLGERLGEAAEKR